MQPQFMKKLLSLEVTQSADTCIQGFVTGLVFHDATAQVILCHFCIQMSIACNHNRLSHSTLFKNYNEIHNDKEMCKYKYTILKSQKLSQHAG